MTHPPFQKTLSTVVLLFSFGCVSAHFLYNQLFYLRNLHEDMEGRKYREVPPLCECDWDRHENRTPDPNNPCKVEGHEKPSERAEIKRKPKHIGF